jgi:hypothetical protein
LLANDTDPDEGPQPWIWHAGRAEGQRSGILRSTDS